MTETPEPPPALIGLKALGTPAKAMAALLDMAPGDFANRATGREPFTPAESIVLALYLELKIESFAKQLDRGGLAPEVSEVLRAHVGMGARCLAEQRAANAGASEDDLATAEAAWAVKFGTAAQADETWWLLEAVAESAAAPIQ